MYKQSPSRNTRSRRIRIKHVLQICLLLAVCIWLIYQVKHSHDKKKEFDETVAKDLLKGNSDESIKLGRKDIQSRSDGTNSKNDEPIEDEEQEVEENKHEEEKPETEIDGEEDILEDDDKERENSDENETRETDMENIDHDGDDKSTHEAREEHYKDDDASSAVTHDAQMETNENENENSNEHSESILENEKTEDRKDLEMEMAKVGNFSTVTSENGSSLNNTIPEGYIGNLTIDELAEVKMVNEDLSLENVTDSKPVPEGISGNSTINVDNNRIGSNSTGSPDVRVDLNTLPEIQTDGDDTAAE